MIDASIVRRIQEKRAYELHTQLCAQIEQAIINAAMDSRTEVLVQLHTAIPLARHIYPVSIRLEDYAYDIERLKFNLKLAGYEFHNTPYTDSFIIKW